MKLFEIVNQRNQLISEREKLKKDYEKRSSELNSKIKKLMELENMSASDLNIEKVLIAEKILEVKGNIYVYVDGSTIVNAAINDIAEGCPSLKINYFGNKKYEGFYQRWDCKYGYGPTHGGIVDKIGLKYEYRKSKLTDDEKDACIYYLKNYEAIVEAKNRTIQP